MNVRFKFESEKKARRAAERLPFDCKYTILHDRTDDVYLEVSEDFEEYIERFIISKTR